jgi:hypothetical protein
VSKHWSDLREEISERTFNPAASPSYVCFFIIAVIGVGAVGFWIELVKLLNNTGSVGATKTAMVTFFWALATTSCMQVIWAKEVKHFTSFSIFLFALCLTAVVICTMSEKNCLVFLCGILASVIALWMWWMVNATPSNLSDDPINDETPLGGDEDKELKGGLNGFKS